MGEGVSLLLVRPTSTMRKVRILFFFLFFNTKRKTSAACRLASALGHTSCVWHKAASLAEASPCCVCPKTSWHLWAKLKREPESCSAQNALDCCVQLCPQTYLRALCQIPRISRADDNRSYFWGTDTPHRWDIVRAFFSCLAHSCNMLVEVAGKEGTFWSSWFK